MDAADVAETEYWRSLDRHAQGLTGPRSLRAQAVIDVANDAHRTAAQQGRQPIDDLLSLHGAVRSAAARQLVARAIWYLRADTSLASVVISLPTHQR